MRFLPVILTGLLANGASASEVPRVVTDIAPVHSIVARIMEGVGRPEVLLPPGTSPHVYALKPSDAAAIEAADMVVWIGDALTPFLEGPIANLAPNAVSLELMEVPETRLVSHRDGPIYGLKDDFGDQGHSHGHDHKNHDHGYGHNHGDSDSDPHVWLDPSNAMLWYGTLAEELSKLDPANAGLYFANASAGVEELTALDAQISQTLSDKAGVGFVVFHDAYHYFESHYGIETKGALALSNGDRPSPRRLIEIADEVTAAGITCIFSEPQFDAALVRRLAEATGAQTAVVDPIGADVALGPGHYAQMLRDMAQAFDTCLVPAS